MLQSASVFQPADSLSADSVGIPEAFYPLHAQEAYLLSFNSTLKQSLDSAIYLPRQVQNDSNLLVIHLFDPVAEKAVVSKPAVNQTAAILLFCLYGLLVSLNRLRFYRGSEFSGRKMAVTRLLPLFFVRQQETESPMFALSLFFPICIGFSLCLYVFSALFGLHFPVYLSVILCLSYALLKLLLRFLSGWLLDINPLSAGYMHKKWVAYYNLLLLLVPFVFLCFVYPYVPIFHFFCLSLLLIFIYLIISAITIFLPKLTLHGIFLYFCTLEIVPVVLIAVYFLRY